MLTVEKRTDGILHVVADGQLMTEDYIAFVPRFERLADPSNPILIELGPGFTGWTLGALWRDLKFDVAHQRRFGRMAVVGDKVWEGWGTDASNLLFPSDIRFFDRSRLSAAEAWLLGTAQDERR